MSNIYDGAPWKNNWLLFIFVLFLFLTWLTDEKKYSELISNYFVFLSSQNPLRLQWFRKSNAKLKCPAFKLLTADADEMDHIAFN